MYEWTSAAAAAAAAGVVRVASCVFCVVHAHAASHVTRKKSERSSCGPDRDKRGQRRTNERTNKGNVRKSAGCDVTYLLMAPQTMTMTRRRRRRPMTDWKSSCVALEDEWKKRRRRMTWRRVVLARRYGRRCATRPSARSLCSCHPCLVRFGSICSLCFVYSPPLIVCCIALLLSIELHDVLLASSLASNLCVCVCVCACCAASKRKTRWCSPLSLSLSSPPPPPPPPSRSSRYVCKEPVYSKPFC